MMRYIRADRMRVGMTVDLGGRFTKGPYREILDIAPAAWGEGYLKFSYSLAWGGGVWDFTPNAPIQVRYHASDKFWYEDPDEEIEAAGEGEGEGEPLTFPAEWVPAAPAEVPEGVPAGGCRTGEAGRDPHA